MSTISIEFIAQNRNLDAAGNPVFSGCPSTYSIEVDRPAVPEDVQNLIWEAIETEGIPEGTAFAVDVDIEQDDGSTDHDEGFGVVKKLVLTDTPSRFFRWDESHLATIFAVNREESLMEIEF